MLWTTSLVIALSDSENTFGFAKLFRAFPPDCCVSAAGIKSIALLDILFAPVLLSLCAGNAFSSICAARHPSKMAPTNMRQTRNAKQHELSNSSNSEEDKGEDIKGADPLALTEAQLKMLSLLVKAVAAAVAQVLPRKEDNSKDASWLASMGTSAQQHYSLSIMVPLKGKMIAKRKARSKTRS